MVIEGDDVRRALGNMKNRKAGGCDGLKPEMYKVLLQSEIYVETLRRGPEEALIGRREPEEWKKSKTIMIPKTRRPKVSELRPIALTDVSYKLLMSIEKDKVERHIEENGMRCEEQAGFTEGGDILDNLVILQECVRQTFSKKEELVVVAVDFRKAYDSVRREKIIEILQDFKVPVSLLDLVKRIYCGDQTRIVVERGVVVVDLESGIRQGCSASTTVFQTYYIKDN